MLEVTSINFDIGSNRWVEMKTESSIMQQDLRISRKLLKIFTFVILKSRELEYQQYRKVSGKETEY